MAFKLFFEAWGESSIYRATEGEWYVWLRWNSCEQIWRLWLIFCLECVALETWNFGAHPFHNSWVMIRQSFGPHLLENHLEFRIFFIFCTTSLSLYYLGIYCNLYLVLFCTRILCLLGRAWWPLLWISCYDLLLCLFVECIVALCSHFQANCLMWMDVCRSKLSLWWQGKWDYCGSLWKHDRMVDWRAAKFKASSLF